jgi:hypothetical protein
MANKLVANLANDLLLRGTDQFGGYGVYINDCVCLGVDYQKTEAGTISNYGHVFFHGLAIISSGRLRFRAELELGPIVDIAVKELGF